MTRIFEFPELPGVTPDLRRDLVKLARQRHLSQGEVVFTPGAPVNTMLILISGTLLVEQAAQTGREIVLYRVHGGESCILTAASGVFDKMLEPHLKDSQTRRVKISDVDSAETANQMLGHVEVGLCSTLERLVEWCHWHFGEIQLIGVTRCHI